MKVGFCLAGFFLIRPAQAEEAATSSLGEAAPAKADEPSPGRLGLGGALRFGYALKSWDSVNAKRGGDFSVDTFRLNMALEYQKFFAESEYRFYGELGSYLKSGSLGVHLNPDLSLRVGVTKVPFGLLPYASHSWFFNLGYYVGLEDDHDMGGVLEWTPENWEFHLGYFHSDEGHYFGHSLDSARYSYDLVRVAEVVDPEGTVVSEAAAVKEQHTGALRVTHAFPHAYGQLLLGGSALVGGLYDESLQKYGHQLALSGFLQQVLGAFDLMAQIAYVARRAPADSDSSSAESFWMGAYDSAYRVAREFALLEVGAGYTFDLDWGPLTSVQVYDDFGAALKTQGGATSYQNVTGALFSSKYVYTYVDFAAGKNQPWLGGDWVSSLAEGDPDAPWELRFNINVGLYYMGWVPLVK